MLLEVSVPAVLYQHYHFQQQYVCWKSLLMKSHVTCDVSAGPSSHCQLILWLTRKSESFSLKHVFVTLPSLQQDFFLRVAELVTSGLKVLKFFTISCFSPMSHVLHSVFYHTHFLLPLKGCSRGCDAGENTLCVVVRRAKIEVA